MASKILSSRPVISLPLSSLDNIRHRRRVMSILHSLSLSSSSYVLASSKDNTSSINTNKFAFNTPTTSHNNTPNNNNNNNHLHIAHNKKVFRNTVGSALIANLVKDINDVSTVSSSLCSLSSSLSSSSSSWQVTDNKVYKFLRSCVEKFQVSFSDFAKISSEILRFLTTHHDLFESKFNNNIYKLILGGIHVVLGPKVTYALVHNNPFLVGGVQELDYITKTMGVSTSNSNESGKLVLDNKSMGGMYYRHYIS